jgi:hypothetical protein
MRLIFLRSFPRPEWKFRVTRVNGPYTSVVNCDLTVWTFLSLLLQSLLPKISISLHTLSNDCIVANNNFWSPNLLINIPRKRLLMAWPNRRQGDRPRLVRRSNNSPRNAGVSPVEWPQSRRHYLHNKSRNLNRIIFISLVGKLLVSPTRKLVRRSPT